MGVTLVRNGDERGSARVNDIPGMLRVLAHRLERGADPMPRTMLWVAYDEDGEVRIGAVGDCPSKLELVGMLELAKQLMSPAPGGVVRG